MSDTTQAPTAPPPMAIRTGHRARIVQGIYMAKATIENGDTGMVRLYFKGQSLDHTQKTQGNYSTYMTIRQREEVIQKIEAYWPEFANMITNGTEYVFRPFLTITFECKSGQDTSAVDIVRIEEYRPPNFPPHFNTYDKFDGWFREHGLNTYDAKAVLGNDFAEWKREELETYAAQVAVKREQEQTMAKQQTPQAQAPRENLDEWAKRQEADDEPHADRGGHWIDNENTRRHIMAWLNEKMEERQAPKGEWRKEWAAKQCNVATGKVHEYTGSRDNFQKTVWSAIERHDKERMALGKLLLDAKLLRDSVWADIFSGQATFWDTVASGATLDDIADKVEAYIEAAKNAATTNEKTPAGATTPEPPPTTNSAPDNAGYQASAQKLPPVQSKGQIIPMLPTTLTGISILDIAKRMNDHLPAEAYSAIPTGVMQGKTDLDADRVRDRFEEVFGPMGVGWKITPNPTAGRVEYRNEIRTSGAGKDQKWHIVSLVAHTLWYAIVDAQGQISWVESSTTSDSHDNMDETYAYRGAMTSLMKQFYRLIGGMNHIIYGEYDHNKARRDVNGKRSA